MFGSLALWATEKEIDLLETTVSNAAFFSLQSLFRAHNKPLMQARVQDLSGLHDVPGMSGGGGVHNLELSMVL